MKKRITSICAILLAAIVCFACGNDSISYTEDFPKELNRDFLITQTKDFHYNETDFSKRALIQQEKIMKMFYRPETKKMSAGYYNNNWADSYLWGYGAAQTMTVAVYRANPTNAGAKESLQNLADGIDNYKSFSSTDVLSKSLFDNTADLAPGETKRADDEWMRLNREVLQPDENGRVSVKYYGSNTSGGDPYYDDNIWCIIALLETGLLLDDTTYIEKAELAMNYIFTGWDFRQGGGVLWKLNWNSKNTCINGPAVMACNMFYECYASDAYTGEDKELKKDYYLKWAKEIYEWTRDVLMDSADYTYYDNINVNGTINDSKFSYNTGTMISAGVGLYHITGEDRYLDEAQDTMRGGYVHFVKRDPLFQEGLDIYPDFTWFNVYLFRGFIDVANVTGNSAYVDSVKNAYDFGWKNARNYYGLMKKDVTGRTNTAKENWQEIDLLHVSANAEILAMLGSYYKA